MSERPDISACPDAATFRRWYYLKEELVAYARAHRISSAGNKFAVIDRIAHFLDTGERLRPSRTTKPQSDFGWHSAPLFDDTVITDSYRNTQNARRYFKARIDGFAFSIALMDWMKVSAGKRLAYAVVEAKWLQDAKSRGVKKPDQPRNQYNAYTRAYFTAVPDGSQEELRRLWAARRALSGPYVFAVDDLRLARTIRPPDTAE